MSVLRDAARIEQVLPQAHTVLFHRNQVDPLAHHPVGQVRLMRALVEGSKTATALSKVLGLSPSSLTQMTTRMIATGLVEKGFDVQDRRIRKLSLTPTGRSIMEQRQQVRVQEAAKVLQTMHPERRTQLIDILEELASANVDELAEVAP